MENALTLNLMEQLVKEQKTHLLQFSTVVKGVVDLQNRIKLLESKDENKIIETNLLKFKKPTELHAYILQLYIQQNETIKNLNEKINKLQQELNEKSNDIKII